MNTNRNPDNKFVGYEYQTFTVPRELDGLWVDSLNAFGWSLEKDAPAVVKHVWGPLRVMMAPLAVFGGKFREAVTDHDSMTHVELTCKRDRRIEHKGELNKLQFQYENRAKSIETLEASKKASAAAAAYGIGLAGTVFMAISVFSYLAAMTPAFIIAAVPGFLGWIIPFFAYKSLVARKAKQVDPQIEAQHGKICELCQQAAKIVSAA